MTNEKSELVLMLRQEIDAIEKRIEIKKGALASLERKVAALRDVYDLYKGEAALQALKTTPVPEGADSHAPVVTLKIEEPKTNIENQRVTEAPAADPIHPAPVVSSPRRGGHAAAMRENVFKAVPYGERVIMLNLREHDLWMAIAEELSIAKKWTNQYKISTRAKIPVGSMGKHIADLVKKGILQRIEAEGGVEYWPVVRPETIVPVLGQPSPVSATQRPPDLKRTAPLAVTPPAVKKEQPRRRFTENKATVDPAQIMGLPATHPAMVEMRTLFPNMITDAADSPRLLISGANQRKLGDRVTKGAWRGMPIFTLTLEERATCPSDCYHLADCYGNSMHWSRRHRNDGTLPMKLSGEVQDLAAKYPEGFVVRLHILGDFYSLDYVMLWRQLLDQFPALHVWGYTAWKANDVIGLAVDRLKEAQPERFAIRRSSPESLPGGATTIRRLDRGQVAEGLVCPAQTEPMVSCGSCGLCWSPRMKDKTIVFINHGRKGTPAPSAEVAVGTTEGVTPSFIVARPSPPRALQGLGENCCSTFGCTGPRQPGRDRCSKCLQAAMPKNSRADMREGIHSGSNNYGD